MKVRVLYPAALAELKKPPKGGDVIELTDKEAKAMIEAGYCEATNAKPVEQATAAPGEKRTTRKK